MSMSFLSLLEAAGFRIRGKRADCLFCPGVRRLTVAIDERKGVAFCHRCQWRTSARRLARQQGITLPLPKLARTRAWKARFQSWLSTTSDEMSRSERTLARRAVLAAEVLRHYSDCAPAWDALAEWYHARRKFEVFWSNVSDRLGRIALYKMWRANAQ